MKNNKAESKRTVQKAYPISGTLYHRVNGRYINADTPHSGPFYFRYRKPDGTDYSRCLNTEDRREAVIRANEIVTGQNRENDYAPYIPETKIEDVWDRFEENYLDATDATMDDFKQVFRRFVKWTEKRAPDQYRGKIKFASDVTRELSREYFIQVCAEKITGPRDKNILHTIWKTVFQSQPNPWNLGITPKKKQRDPGDKSRRIWIDEARRFREAILQEAKEWPDKEDGKQSRVMTPDLLYELYNAVAFSWWYGMRVGSLCALKWEDFKNSEWFLHVPPKTRKCRPDPLQLPIVPEIQAVLDRLKKNANSEWLFPNLHALYNKRGLVIERELGFQTKRSANRTGQAEFARDVKKLFKKAGIEDDFNGRASMHGFRKSCANNLAEHNCSVFLIRSILGWAGDREGIENRYIMGPTVESKKESLLKSIKPLDETMPDSATRVEHFEIERIIDEL